jgi:hypothetical protein
MGYNDKISKFEVKRIHNPLSYKITTNCNNYSDS